jgi:hypothetical protein
MSYQEIVGMDKKKGMLECPTQTWKKAHRGRL